MIPRSGWLRVSVHDLQGRTVANLLDAHATAGPGAIDWNGRDASGRDTGDGVFFARLEWNGQVRCQRLVRIRR